MSVFPAAAKEGSSVAFSFFFIRKEGSAYCSLHLPILACYFFSNLSYIGVPI